MTDVPERGAQVIDLMEALRASLEKKSGKPAKAAGAKVAEPKSAEPKAEARKPPKRAQAAEPAARKKARG